HPPRRDDRRDRPHPAAAGRGAPPADPGAARAQPRRDDRGGQGAARRWRTHGTSSWAAGPRGRGVTPMAVGLEHYLAVAAILFTTGVFGIFLNRKNVIIIMMSIELMLLAVNINFVAFSVALDD